MTRFRYSSGTIRAMAPGLTLVELMIVVAILSILAGVAWPLYEKQAAKQRVTDGVILISKAQTRMERCLLDKGSYENCPLNDLTSPKGYYRIANTNPGATTFTLTATPTDETLDVYTDAGIPSRYLAPLTIDELGRKTGPWPDQ